LKQLKIKTQSSRETQSYAEKMAQSISLGSVIALIGDLGTGKTTFAQGFAQGFKVRDFVNSPTFKLVSQFEGATGNLFHIDCFRLKGGQDFLNIGGEHYLSPDDGVTLIEWADVIRDILPENTIIIRFNRDRKNKNFREVTISGWIQ